MLKKFMNKTTVLVSICLLILGTVFTAAPVQARYAGTADCDNNAIIRCGVSGEAEARQKFSSDAFVRRVYNHFSIPNEAALTGMVKGRITKSGEIWVGNERLATGAVTAGRTKMGADEVQVPGANAWMRPPSRSFRSNSLEMLVKLNSRGEFTHGVIMSCGNPVQAAHKVQKPTPKPPAPTPKPQPKPQPQPKPTPKPVTPKLPKLEISKDVQLRSPSEGWGPFWVSDELEADPGSEIRFRITIKNTGDGDMENTVLKDSPPEGMTFQADAVLEGSAAVTDNTVGELIGEGIQIGTIAPGQSVEVIFRATIGETTDACETPLRNIAKVIADKIPEGREDAQDDVEVKVCQQEEEEAPAAPVQPDEPEQPQPQVQSATTLPETGAAGAVGVFSITSFLGFAAYKLKEFYSILLR